MLEIYKIYTYISYRNKCAINILFDTRIRNSDLCKINSLSVGEDIICIGDNGKTRG